eukprot:gene20093-24054_t
MSSWADRDDKLEKGFRGAPHANNVLGVPPKTLALIGGVILLFLCIGTFQYYQQADETYAVVFDAGSTGSRVHVFRFQGPDLELQDELFEALKPGLRAFATDPQEAANSLKPLLEKALERVPADKRAQTPLTLRATAGLRLLPEGAQAAADIMEKVAELLKASGFNVKDSFVSILGGDLEGAFGWLCVNYLANKLGGKWEDTVAMMDMGGGSMQMAYAVSDE